MLEDSSGPPQLPPALRGPFETKDDLKAALVLHDPQRRPLQTMKGQSNTARVAIHCCPECTVLFFSFASPLLSSLVSCLAAVQGQRNIARCW